MRGTRERPRVIDERSRDMAALGIPPERAAQLLEQLEDDDAGDPETPEVLDVLPANWPTVRLFCACGTQWRVAAMGGPLGLDYAGVEAAMRMMGMEANADLFERLRLIEGEALAAMGEEAEVRRGE